MTTSFILFGQETSALEITGFITGVLGVWLTIRRSILCFPIGIINVLIYAYLFQSENVRLYADALLQIIYLILLVYGWMVWNRSKNEKEEIRTVSILLAKKLVIIGVLSTIALGVFLSLYTNASLPYLDAALTIISLIAQWMIAKKMIENWLLWIVVNTIYIPLYVYKGLAFTSILYLLFLILAINGWYNWRKIKSNERLTQ